MGWWRVSALVAMGLVLVSVVPSDAQTASGPGLTLRVTAVNGAQAVVTDLTTGVQTMVQVGDVIQGWTVVAITPSSVEIEREEPEQGQTIRAQLSVGLGGQLVPSP
jgi:hypothetical protein